MTEWKCKCLHFYGFSMAEEVGSFLIALFSIFPVDKGCLRRLVAEIIELLR